MCFGFSSSLSGGDSCHLVLPPGCVVGVGIIDGNPEVFGELKFKQVKFLSTEGNSYFSIPLHLLRLPYADRSLATTSQGLSYVQCHSFVQAYRRTVVYDTLITGPVLTSRFLDVLCVALAIFLRSSGSEREIKKNDQTKQTGWWKQACWLCVQRFEQMCVQICKKMRELCTRTSDDSSYSFIAQVARGHWTTA